VDAATGPDAFLADDAGGLDWLPRVNDGRGFEWGFRVCIPGPDHGFRTFPALESKY
jgi:hypothetical protein